VEHFLPSHRQLYGGDSVFAEDTNAADPDPGVAAWETPHHILIERQGASVRFDQPNDGRHTPFNVCQGEGFHCDDLQKTHVKQVFFMETW
jgi:hypothetical protein